MNKEIDQIISEFAVFDDWQDKYAYIIDLGKRLPSLDESQKTDDNKVTGCISQVWLVHTEEDGKHYFQADSDAFIVKGLLAIILRIFSGKTKAEIVKTNFQMLFDSIGLENHLSVSRSNGVHSVVRKIIASMD